MVQICSRGSETRKLVSVKWVVDQESFVGSFWTLSGESATEYAGANMIKRVLNEEKTVKWVVFLDSPLPAPAAAENGRIGGGLSPLILRGEGAPLLHS